MPGSDQLIVDGVPRSRFNSKGDLIDPQDDGLADFWRWFEDSAAVDRQGRPLVVYHGTDEDFSIFDHGCWGKHDPGIFGRGFYFSAQHGIAKSYGSKVGQFYVKVECPLTAEDVWTPGCTWENKLKHAVTAAIAAGIDVSSLGPDPASAFVQDVVPGKLELAFRNVQHARGVAEEMTRILQEHGRDGVIHGLEFFDKEPGVEYPPEIEFTAGEIMVHEAWQIRRTSDFGQWLDLEPLLRPQAPGRRSLRP